MSLSIHEPFSTNFSSFIDALKVGSSTAIIGMVIVFAVLAVIFAALVLMRKVLGKKADAPETPEAPAIEQVPEASVAEEAADDTAVIAAIIAAISAHTGKAPSAFRVVSFKRRY